MNYTAATYLLAQDLWSEDWSLTGNRKRPDVRADLGFILRHWLVCETFGSGLHLAAMLASRS